MPMPRRLSRASATAAVSRRGRGRRRILPGQLEVWAGAALDYYRRRQEIPMKSAYGLLAAILLVGPSTVGFGAQGRSGQPPAPPLVDADHRIMQPESGL